MQQKIFEAITRKDAAGKVYWVASTNHPDRQGDRMNPQKFDLSGWQRNGAILLWGHDYQSAENVIGRAVDVEVTPTAFKVLPQWREPASPTDKMHVVRSLIEQGLAKAMSIGFRPLEAPQRNSYGGSDYGAVELLEISVVPVPANSYASLSYARRRGVNCRGEAMAGMQLCATLAGSPEWRRRASEGQQAELLLRWVDLAKTALT